MLACPPSPSIFNPTSKLLLKLEMIVKATTEADELYLKDPEDLLAEGCCGCDSPGQLAITESGLWFMVWAAVVGGGATYNDLLCCYCPKTELECEIDGLLRLCEFIQNLDAEYDCGDLTPRQGTVPCCSCYTPAQIRSAINRALLDWIIALGDSDATLQQAYEHGRSFNPMGRRSVNCIMYRAIPIPA